jgi:hypothetical protein
MSLDTIDGNVMQAAAETVVRYGQSVPIIHTVTITLDGASGHALCKMQGFFADDEAVTAEVTL